MGIFIPEKEFLNEFANWDGLNSICITVDIDFAPDYMISNLFGILNEFDASATIFATHNSKLLQETTADEKIEIGTHPNLSPGSTQGENLESIVENLRIFYPGITGNRFHLLKYSYRDLIKLGQMDFRYDVSTIRFNCSYLLPAFHKDLNMVLFTYLWEDGVCENAGLPMKLENIDLESPGVKIINFHPMNVYINGSDSEARLNFLYENSNLINCPQEIADKHRCSGDGAETVLRSLLTNLKERNCRTVKLKDLSDAYLRSIDLK